MLYDLASDLDRQRATKRWEYLVQRKAVVDLTEHVQRTNSQNAYLHVLLGVLAMEFGERIEYVKQNYYKELVNPALFVMCKDDRFLGERVELRSSRDLTKEETRAIIGGAVKAGLLIGSVFFVAFGLFILFCVFVWFR